VPVVGGSVVGLSRVAAWGWFDGERSLRAGGSVHAREGALSSRPSFVAATRVGASFSEVEIAGEGSSRLGSATRSPAVSRSAASAEVPTMAALILIIHQLTAKLDVPCSAKKYSGALSQCPLQRGRGSGEGIVVRWPLIGSRMVMLTVLRLVF